MLLLLGGGGPQGEAFRNRGNVLSGFRPAMFEARTDNSVVRPVSFEPVWIDVVRPVIKEID